MSFGELCKYNYDIYCGKDGDIFYLCLRLKTKITPMNRYTKSTIYLSFLFLFGGVQIPAAVHAQDATFTPPFDFPITFSGNFGEIRANHFHGGLDFKTGGTIGKPVHALAEGYISRIRVTHGSGYVLDVAYNNGYKTINRHLSTFVGDVARSRQILPHRHTPDRRL